MKYLFGYVTPYKDELKVREYNLFKAYYCGLCKALGKEFNQLVRIGLSNDFAFLALLLSANLYEREEISAQRCIYNPMSKKPIVKTNRAVQYSAYMSVILAWFKLIDDWKDDRKISALVAMTAYILPVRRARKRYPEKYEKIQSGLKHLSDLEKERCNQIDESADAFARIMQEIFVPPFIEEIDTQKILALLGYDLGRWIYILDAFHDLQNDIEKNRYNPIFLQYKEHFGKNLEDSIRTIQEPIENTLIFTLDHAARSYELLEIKQNKSILDNIFYMGMRNRMEQIFEKGSCSKNERSL